MISKSMKTALENQRKNGGKDYQPIEVYRLGYACKQPKHFNPWYHEPHHKFHHLWKKGWEDRYYQEKQKQNVSELQIEPEQLLGN